MVELSKASSRDTSKPKSIENTAFSTPQVWGFQNRICFGGILGGISQAEIQPFYIAVGLKVGFYNYKEKRGIKHAPLFFYFILSKGLFCSYHNVGKNFGLCIIAIGNKFGKPAG